REIERVAAHDRRQRRRTEPREPCRRVDLPGATGTGPWCRAHGVRGFRRRSATSPPTRTTPTAIAAKMSQFVSLVLDAVDVCATGVPSGATTTATAVGCS